MKSIKIMILFRLFVIHQVFGRIWVSFLIYIDMSNLAVHTHSLQHSKAVIFLLKIDFWISVTSDMFYIVTVAK